MVKLTQDQEEHLKLTLLQLRCSFQAIESVVTKWREVCCNGQACARKVAYLSEQLEVCHSANLNLIPSDIKEKLQSKIRNGIEEELIELNEFLKELKENEKVIKSECYHAEKVYTEKSKHLDLCVQNTGSPSHPSISKMVEYIYMLQSFFVKDFLMRKFSLAKLNFEDKISVCDLNECWEEFNIQKMGLIDFESLVQNFLHQNVIDSHNNLL